MAAGLIGVAIGGFLVERLLFGLEPLGVGPYGTALAIVLTSTVRRCGSR